MSALDAGALGEGESEKQRASPMMVQAPRIGARVVRSGGLDRDERASRCGFDGQAGL
jgi:hypothetical protein